jgi:hypothetical protein
MTEKSTTTQAGANSSAPKSRTAQNETMREKVMMRSLTNPRFKVAKPSGKGFVIVGAKPLTHDAALADYNPNHEPAASSKGGQFAPAAGGAWRLDDIVKTAGMVGSQ